MRRKSKKACKHKNRTTAVILALLFGMYSWLYTYEVDSTKFWSAVVLYVFQLIMMYIGSPVWKLIGGFIWIWAVLDALLSNKFGGR